MATTKSAEELQKEIDALTAINAQLNEKLALAEKQGFKTVIKKSSKKEEYEITSHQFNLDGKIIKAEDVTVEVMDKLIELGAGFIKPVTKPAKS